MKYIERINELRKEEEFLKRELDIARKEKKEFWKNNREILMNQWIYIQDSSLRQVLIKTDTKLRELENIVSDLTDQLYKVQDEIFNLRNEYRNSRRGEYYRPLDSIDIQYMIHKDGSIIGFKL